jgi:hypothetical protein
VTVGGESTWRAELATATYLVRGLAGSEHECRAFGPPRVKFSLEFPDQVLKRLVMDLATARVRARSILLQPR